MPGSRKDTKLGKALRAEGLVMLPPLWIYPEDMPDVHKIASKATEQVNKKREEIRKIREIQQEQMKRELETEKAWKSHIDSKSD
jgi:hypothetical protein